MTTFQYSIELVSEDRGRAMTVEPWVDTGALYSQFPASLLQGLGYEPNATRRFRLADGSVIECPIGGVFLRIGREQQSVICVFGEENADMLLGATTLELFSLAADPVNHTLVPTVARMLTLLDDATGGPSG